MIFFTADTHFGDPRVLRLDRRPFGDLAAHDEALVAAWNAVVSEDDEVWHLGDVARRGGAEPDAILSRLAGAKHLVCGNNDDEVVRRSPHWRSVRDYAELEVDGRRLVLCHYAFRTWNGMGKGALNLHGHSHGRLKPAPRQYDVGVDSFPFRPVTLGEILASRRRRGGATPDANPPEFV